MDLKDFFRLIHEISGLNVVLDPTVHGAVTLVLDEVPWDQALDIVLKNNGLNKELDGNVLRIVTQDTLRREADTKRDLVKAQNDAVQSETVTRKLSYAKASELVAPLKRFLTPRGDIMAIDRSNTLIIRDIPDSIPGDRQPDPATGPQVAASGNRGSRRVGLADVRALHRNAVRDGGWNLHTRLSECARRRPDRIAGQPHHASPRFLPWLLWEPQAPSLCFRTSRRTRPPAA